jgi:hypothetical protein
MQHVVEGLHGLLKAGRAEVAPSCDDVEEVIDTRVMT